MKFHFCQKFNNDGMMNGIPGISTPYKGTMIGNEHSGYFFGI